MKPNSTPIGLLLAAVLSTWIVQTDRSAAQPTAQATEAVRICLDTDLRKDLVGVASACDEAVASKSATSDEMKRLLLRQGDAKFWLRDFRGSLATFDALTEMEPENALAHSHRSRAAFRSARRNGDPMLRLAQDEMRKAIDLGPDCAVCWQQAGFIYSIFGSPREAEAAYRRAIEIDPKEWVAAYQLANLQRSQYREAESRATLDRAISTGLENDEHITVFDESGAYVDPLGLLLVERAALSSAFVVTPEQRLADLDAAAARGFRSSNSDDARYRITSLLDLRRFDEARVVLDRLLVEDPSDLENHVLKSHALSRSGDREGAIRAMRETDTRFPKSAFVKWSFGWLLASHGDTTEAKSTLLAAMLIHPKYARDVVDRLREHGFFDGVPSGLGDPALLDGLDACLVSDACSGRERRPK